MKKKKETVVIDKRVLEYVLTECNRGIHHELILPVLRRRLPPAFPTNRSPIWRNPPHFRSQVKRFDWIKGRFSDIKMRIREPSPDPPDPQSKLLLPTRGASRSAANNIQHQRLCMHQESSHAFCKEAPMSRMTRPSCLLQLP